MKIERRITLTLNATEVHTLEDSLNLIEEIYDEMGEDDIFTSADGKYKLSESDIAKLTDLLGDLILINVRQKGEIK